MDLLPVHREYLHGLRINEMTIAENGLKSVPPYILHRRYGIPNSHTGLRFPYAGTPYSRVLLFPAVVGNAKIIEYWEPVCPRRIYVPSVVRDRLSDDTEPLVIVNAEVDALALAQSGICAIRTSVIQEGTNRLTRSRLIADLAPIKWTRPKIFLVLPHVLWLRPERAREAVANIEKWLTSGGARAVRLVRVPSRADGRPQGIAAYLATQASAIEAWTQLIRDSRPVSDLFAPSPIPVDVQNGLEDRVPAHRAGQHYDAGELVYGVGMQNGTVFVSSRRNNTWFESTEENPKLLPNTFRAAAIGRYLCEGTVDVADLVDRINKVLREYVIWRHPSEPAALGLWIFGTYLFTLFSHFGYVWLRSVKPQSGKTRVLKLLSLLCCHAAPVTVETTATTLYRNVHDACPTVILDEVENLQVGKRDISCILNAGYEAGTTVPRPEWVDGKRVTAFYQIYCPKALAGLHDLSKPTASRCLRYMMRKKHETESVRDLHPAENAEEFAALRDGLYIAALTHAEEVAAIYAQRRTFPLPACDDRARDILNPLYAIAALLDRHRRDQQMTTALCAFVQRQAEIRTTLAETDDALERVVRALATIPFDADGEAWLTPKELRALVEKEGVAIASDKQLGMLLRTLGCDSKSHRFKDSLTPTRAYRFTRDGVQELKGEYGLS